MRGIPKLYDRFVKVTKETIERKREALRDIQQVRDEFAKLIDIIYKILPNRTFIKGEIFWMLKETEYNLDTSILLALGGYYRHAHAALRYMLEFTILSVYFCDHPIEFQWWESGEKHYTVREIYENYIPKLRWFKFYEEIRGSSNLKSDINQLYKKLSAYVHGQGVKKREAKPSPILTEEGMGYDEDKFKSWFDCLKKVYKMCATILIIHYYRDFPVLELEKSFKMLPNKNKQNLLDFLNHIQKETWEISGS